LNPEDITKESTKRKGRNLNEKDFKWKRADLDVPGSELDDQQENGKRRRKQLLQYAETTIMI
jgi:hypothetical protein